MFCHQGGHPEGVFWNKGIQAQCANLGTAALTGMVKIHKRKINITVFNCICLLTLSV